MWVRSSLEKTKYLFKYVFIFPFLHSRRGQARHWVLPLNTLRLQNPTECEERSVLTLGSLCLSCRGRDTAWSWFSYLFFNIYVHIFMKYNLYYCEFSTRMSVYVKSRPKKLISKNSCAWEGPWSGQPISYLISPLDSFLNKGRIVSEY